jgi:TetR/AcrR family transcriptional regulator, repressor of fatR-cypB operon
MRAARTKKVVDKRTAIIDAAVTLFAHRGFYGTTVPEIAQAAGVATGSIYLYFKTKEELVNAALTERKQGMLDTLVAAAGAGGDFETRFRRVWRQLVAYAVAHPADFLFFEMHHHAAYIEPATRAAGDRIMAVAVDFMREVMAAHGLASPGPEALVSLVWGALVGLLKAADQHYLRLDPQLVEAAGLVLWRAVGGSVVSPPLSNERP